MKNSIYNYNDFCYYEENTKTKNHCEYIRASNIEDNDDIRRYRDLINNCFDLHVQGIPEKLSKDEIKMDVKESFSFFRPKDISDLFITEFYEYPPIMELDKHDITFFSRTIQSSEVFSELLGKIADPEKALILIGDVGEGKTTFLRKLSLDLQNYDKGDLKYFPIIIDMQTYDEIIETDNIDGLWLKICSDIIFYIEQKYKITIPTTITNLKETETKLITDIHTLIKFVFAGFKTTIIQSDRDRRSTTSVRNLDLYSQLQIAASQMYDRGKKRLVLIFDNLDTFYYEHERFMLFESGFRLLKSKILTVRDFIKNVYNSLSSSGISYIFTVRPYVYNHIFQSSIHDTSLRDVGSVYRIKSVDPKKPIESRSDMLELLANKLKDSDLPEGKKKSVEHHNNQFLDIIKKCLDSKELPFLKLYNLANQGMRSMVEFYRSCDYHPKIYQRYFTHNIIHLYILGKRKLYSQIIPDICSGKQIYFFPNMFLVMCPNYYNEGHYDAHKEHKITYWLKYFILWVCCAKGKISIKSLLQIFSDYEEHVVRLVIGSLATVNEYNCLKMDFLHHIEIGNKNEELISAIKKFEATTYLAPTRRGKFLIEEDYCFDFDCLQHYVDDWLLPLPKSDKLSAINHLIKSIYAPNNKKYNYEYLLDASNYEENRTNMIRMKAKLSLLFIYFLKSALIAEKEKYPNTWQRCLSR